MGKEDWMLSITRWMRPSGRGRSLAVSGFGTPSGALNPCGRQSRPAANTLLGLAVLVCLMTPSLAVASDHDVQTQLKQAYARAGWDEVRVAVEQGVVTLKGEVPHGWARQEIEKEARRATGVTRVVNEVSVPRITDDTALERAVAEQLQGHMPGSMFDEVSATVLGGTAVLIGYLTSPDKLPSLVDVVARTPGIQSVMSQVEILPDSDVDQQLRMAIAAALATEPALGDAAAASSAPIRILVKNAHVKLTGSVATSQDRARAEEVICSVTGVLSVENRLSVTEPAR
jgi:osmotically-inducible protein OsmY